MLPISEAKCKTNLKLAIQRLKLLASKKAENATKSRSEIASYLMANKIDRAKIKVEHLIREDYMLEAMELVEMFCDLLLARFGIFMKMRQVDVAVEEAVSSIIWAGPRMESEVPELRKVINLLLQKLGKVYIDQCTSNSMQTVNEKLIQRMSVEAPSRVLIERYLTEIAASHGVPYKPDPVVMNQDRQWNLGEQYLINLNQDNAESCSISNASLTPPSSIFNPIYPSAPTMADEKTQASRTTLPGPSSDYMAASDWFISDKTTSMPAFSEIEINLPDVPSSEVAPPKSEDDLDLEEINKRFEELKKRK